MASWVWLGLLSSLAHALIPLVSEYFKVKAIHLLFWLRVLAIIALLPMIRFFVWPDDLRFYLFVCLASIVFALCDLYKIGLATKNGAGVVSRVEPLAVVGTFIFWLAINPELLLRYLLTPMLSLGVLLSVLGGAYFALRLKGCELSRQTIQILWPVIILSSIGVIFSKLAMDYSPLHSGVFFYAFLQAVVVLTIYSIILTIPELSRRLPSFDAQSLLFSRQTMLAGLCAGTFHLFGIFAKYYGISSVENPAYVTMLSLTSPLWILLIYRVCQRKEKADVMSGLGLVFCTGLLVFFTQS